MLYKRTDIVALKAALAQVPPESVNVTTREAVAEIAGEVRGLRAKRYAWEQITELLGERGLKVSRWTLARYMRGSPRAPRQKKVDSSARRKAAVTEDIAGHAETPPGANASGGRAHASPLVAQETKVGAGHRTSVFPVTRYGIDDL